LLPMRHTGKNCRGEIVGMRKPLGLTKGRQSRLGEENCVSHKKEVNKDGIQRGGEKEWRLGAEFPRGEKPRACVRKVKKRAGKAGGRMKTKGKNATRAVILVRRFEGRMVEQDILGRVRIRGGRGT